MDRIRIVGGHPLIGSLIIGGAKNAALPLMIASLLTRETLTLHNVPRLSDVRQLLRIIGNHAHGSVHFGGVAIEQGELFAGLPPAHR